MTSLVPKPGSTASLPCSIRFADIAQGGPLLRRGGPFVLSCDGNTSFTSQALAFAHFTIAKAWPAYGPSGRSGRNAYGNGCIREKKIGCNRTRQACARAGPAGRRAHFNAVGSVRSGYR